MTFFLTIVFVVLVFWRPQEWLVPQLQGWPLLDAVVYTALLGLLMEVQQGKLRFPKTPAVGLLFGLWIMSAFSHVPHTYVAGIIETLPDTGKICFFSLLLLCVLDRPSRARVFAAVLVLGACIMAVHALRQQETGYGFAGGEPLFITKPSGEMQIRTQFFGIFADPNDMSQILAAAMPLAFGIPRRMSVLTFIGCALLCGMLLMPAFLSTHSRGGMVGLATAAGVAILLRVPDRVFPGAVGVLLLVGLALAGTKGGAMLDMSAQERVVFWGMANEVFKHNPIFGIGYGMFYIVARDRAAHNAFVSCYTEIGLAGYWFWFGLLFLAAIGCWRVRLVFANPRDDEERFMRRFTSICLVTFSGFMASAYFLSRSWVYPLFFLMALLNSLPLIARSILPADTPEFFDMRRDVLVGNSIASILSVIYIYVSIVLLNAAYYG